MFIIGIDPHKGSHQPVVIDRSERVIDANPRQRDRLLEFATPFMPLTWAIEGERRRRGKDSGEHIPPQLLLADVIPEVGVPRQPSAKPTLAVQRDSTPVVKHRELAHVEARRPWVSKRSGNFRSCSHFG